MPPTFNYLTNSQAAGESTTLSSATITPQNTGDWLFVASSYPYATPTNAWQNMTVGSAGGVVQQIAPNTSPINYTFSPLSGESSASTIIFDFVTNGSSPYESQDVSFGGGGIGTSGQATFSSPIVQGDSILVVFQNNTFYDNQGAMTLTDNAGNMYLHVATGVDSEPHSQVDVFIALAVPASSSLTMNWTAAVSIGDGEGTAWVVKNLLTIPPTVNIFFQAVPEAIMKGQSSTLQWVVTGATSQTIDNGIGAIPASGTAVVSPESTNYYHLSAFNTGLPLGFPPLDTSGETDVGTSLLLFVSGETFAGETGTAFNVTLAASEFLSLTITQAIIMYTSRSFSLPPPGGYSVIGTQAVTFGGGNANVTIPPGGSVTTDTIPFAFTDGYDYYIVIYTDNAENVGIAYGASFGAGGNVEVSSQQSGNACELFTMNSWNQDPTYWRVFEGMSVTLQAGSIPTATATAEVEVLSNQATFSLQKIILTLKQDRIPVRGRNGGGTSGGTNRGS